MRLIVANPLITYSIEVHVSVRFVCYESPKDRPFPGMPLLLFVGFHFSIKATFLSSFLKRLLIWQAVGLHGVLLALKPSIVLWKTHSDIVITS